MHETVLSVPNQFSTFMLALYRTKMEHMLKEEKGVTLFLPPNYAWEEISTRNLQYLFSDKGLKDLKEIVLYHVRLWCFLSASTHSADVE